MSLQEAFDIFGDVGDLLEVYDRQKREDADGAEDEQEPDFSDEDAAETFRLEQVQAHTLLILSSACMAPKLVQCAQTAAQCIAAPLHWHS